ncbi:MAG: NADH-quinone oxidoreductase subunit M [Myxococcota bacterium]
MTETIPAAGGFPILSFIVLMPLVAAIVLLFIPDTQRSVVRGWALLGSALSALASGFLAWRYFTEATDGGLMFLESVVIVQKIGLTYTLACDGWSAVLMLLTGIITFSGTWASFTLEDRPREFFVFLLVLVAGVYGVFVAQDLLLFFLFYEIAVLPMYLLIGIWGSSGTIPPSGPFGWAYRMLDVGTKHYAALKLTLMLLVGSALILASFLWIGAESGSFLMTRIVDEDLPWEGQFIVFPLLWIGFGTLAGLWPFHTWSPDGHAAAPTAVSMLHAGVLMKLGAFGVMRVGMVLLPLGARDWAIVVGFVACVNIFYGALSAMAQRDLKYVIAYSSVSHMGIVLLGAAALNEAGWNGAVFQMFAHGVMTGLMFALVGILYERTHDRWIPNLGGFARIMPVVAAGFVLAGLSSLGMPGTAGFAAELLVFVGSWSIPAVLPEGVDQGYAHPFGPLWALVGILGAFLTAVYVLKAAREIFFGDGPPERFAALQDAVGTERVALWTLGACIVIFGAWPRLLLDLVNETTPRYVAPFAIEASENDDASAQTVVEDPEDLKDPYETESSDRTPRGEDG